MNMNEDSTSSTNEAIRRKNRPGRSSRRRKHKARSILLEASGGGTTANNDEVSSSAVPSDRGYTLDGVKVRRREHWLKQRCVLNMSDNEGTSLDPKDDYQLKAQLGFIPGNAICVAARTSLQEVFTPPSTIDCDTTEATSCEQVGDVDPSPPAVLKLYPMAIRETYRGGATDGRKFKARRRGAERHKTSNEGKSNEDNTDNIDHQKLRSKKERRWFIETPSDKLPSNTSRIDTPQDDDESPKHIIEPFPTMYWLTSPKLRILISKMELSKDNNVQTMEKRLRSSQDYLDQMERAHKSYGKSRWNLLTPQDKESVINRQWENALDERRGVAGISLVKGRFDCVKCLHAHVAHYLAQVAEWEDKKHDSGGDCERDDLNLVGMWTMESIEKELAEVGEDDGQA